MSRSDGAGAPQLLMMKSDGGSQPPLVTKPDGGSTDLRPGPPPPPISLMEVGYLKSGAGALAAGSAGAVNTDDVSLLFEHARAINDSAQKTFMSAPMK
jgi:hypothetical protein